MNVMCWCTCTVYDTLLGGWLNRLLVVSFSHLPLHPSPAAAALFCTHFAPRLIKTLSASQTFHTRPPVPDTPIPPSKRSKHTLDDKGCIPPPDSLGSLGTGFTPVCSNFPLTLFFWGGGQTGGFSHEQTALKCGCGGTLQSSTTIKAPTDGLSFR